MQYTLALAALTACASAAPNLFDKRAPLGCDTTYNNGQPFQIGIVNISESMGFAMAKRQTNPNSMPGNALMLSLTNGVLTDQNQRTGYIASNSQLQFDTGAQAGALQTSGFSVCQNGTLALDETTIWYECLSEFEGRAFYNLYTMMQGSQCYMAHIQAIGGMESGDGGVTGGSATESRLLPSATMPNTVSAPTATAAGIDASSVASPLTEATEGQAQPTAGGVVVGSSTVSLMSQIADGQVQAPTTGSVTVSSVTMTPATQTAGGEVQAATDGTTPTPFNENAAPVAVGVSGGWVMGVVAGAVGVGALLL